MTAAVGNFFAAAGNAVKGVAQGAGTAATAVKTTTVSWGGRAVSFLSGGLSFVSAPVKSVALYGLNVLKSLGSYTATGTRLLCNTGYAFGASHPYVAAGVGALALLFVGRLAWKHS